MTKKASTKYAPEVRERAVRMVFEHQGEHASQWTAIGLIAAKIGCTAETLRAYFHRFRTVVFIETDRPCSWKPDSRFHDLDHLFSNRTAPVKGELSV